MRGLFVGLVAVASLAPALSVYALDAEPVAPALAELESHQPAVRVHVAGAHMQLAGAPMAEGATPRESAESFRNRHAAIFGVEPADLEPLPFDAGKSDGQPLMYDRATGAYKFTLYRYAQKKDGIPVYGSDLRLLVRNGGNHPMVLAKSSLRNLKDFKPQAAPATLRFDLRSIATQAIAEAAPLIDFAGNTHQSVDPALTHFTEPQQVIWAGADDVAVHPMLAVTFEADNLDNPDAQLPQRWRFVVDAQTGEILHRENLMHFTDVGGNVSGNATDGHKAMQCLPEVLTPFPYAQTSIQGGNSAYADVNGDYTISNSGTSQVTVGSAIRGRRFIVNHATGANELLTQSVLPPGPADFVHNAADTDELVIAQANGYVNANEVRDWALYYNPSYPVIGTQTNFTVSVNRTDGYCPGNAWYDGSSINFCQSGGGYGNTAFASVSQHEYGHHLVQVGGSGQDQYGEGMSDCVSMLIADDPGLGYGFFLNQCNTPLRSADNTMQYPCSGEGHDCGVLLSGCVWDTRNELLITEPVDYLDIISELTLNSIMLHSGTLITPQITTDFLTLDDDDGDLGNGTPHSAEILAGFGAHNMAPLPAPVNDTCGDAEVICPGSVDGTTLGGTATATSSCGTTDASPDVWYVYTPATNGSATFSLCSGTTYDSVLAVYATCPSGLFNELECDDDGCGAGGGQPSTVTMNVTAGVDYYIRVTGWSGAAGEYRLTVTGPDCLAPLSISFPNGRPQTIAPGTTTNLVVQIDNDSESYVPGSGLLNYSYDGGAFASVPLTPLGGNLYQATFPAPACSDTPEYYISAEGNGGSTVTSPSNAPAGVYTALVGVLTTHFADDFETDQGWTTQVIGASSGQWERGVPVNDPSWDYDPASDSDGSGSCYLTENQTGNTDIDGGAVELTSPVIDMSAGDITISYDYFLRLTDTAGGVDRLLVEINNNGGSGAWTEIARHDTDGGLSWRSHSISQADLDNAGVTLTSNMKVRFNSNDALPASINESGLDAFQVYTFVCNDAATCSDGVLNQGETRIDCGGPCPACACEDDGGCDNGAYCDGAETCDPFGQCIAGAAPCGGGEWCDEGGTGCITYGTGDFEPDGDIDLQDFAQFQVCFDHAVTTPACEPANMTGDGMIDLDDFQSFADELTAAGPN